MAKPYRTSYLAGAKLAMTQRLAAIETWTDSGSGLALVKTYDLTYETSPATARSRLAAVTECDPSDNCLQPVELRDVLARIADRPVNRIEELLPWNMPLGNPES